MKVIAKCIDRAWDSTACVLYSPGQEYEIEHDGRLSHLKTPTGRWVFQFDREATLSPEPAGVITPSPEKDIDPAATAPPEEKPPEDRRGIGPRNCKGCGKPFPNLNALTHHKKSCPGKSVVVITQEAGATV